MKENYFLCLMYANLRKRQRFQLYHGLYYALSYGCTMVALRASPHNNAVVVQLMPAGLHVPIAYGLQRFLFPLFKKQKNLLKSRMRSSGWEESLECCPWRKKWLLNSRMRRGLVASSFSSSRHGASSNPKAYTLMDKRRPACQRRRTQ